MGLFQWLRRTQVASPDGNRSAVGVAPGMLRPEAVVESIARGRFPEISRHPDLAGALSSHVDGAVACAKQYLLRGAWDEALAFGRTALESSAGASDQALACVAEALRCSGRPAEAIATIDRYKVGSSSQCCELLVERAAASLALGDMRGAEAGCEQVLAQHPRDVRALTLRGILDLRRGDYSHARELLERAFASEAVDGDGSFDAFVNLGICLRDGFDRKESIAFLASGLRTRPSPAGYSALAYGLLGLGMDPAGWEFYEARWMLEPGRSMWPVHAGEPLRHQPLAGKTLLVKSEQGYGDTLQYMRFVSRFAGQGARVVLDVPAPLDRLARTVSGVDQVLRSGESLAPDYFVHVGSLPQHFHSDLAGIQAATPYVHADAADTRRMAAAIADLPGLKVGIAWSGNPRHANDSNRSIPISALAPLLDVRGVSFVSLQHPAAAAEQGEGAQGAIRIVHEPGDFADTAALVAALDLVITIDSAVAHLAGALGKPTWILLPEPADWRWLSACDDTPWYSSARLFRPSMRGAATGAVDAAARALAEFAATGTVAPVAEDRSWRKIARDAGNAVPTCGWPDAAFLPTPYGMILSAGRHYAGAFSQCAEFRRVAPRLMAAGSIGLEWGRHDDDSTLEFAHHVGASGLVYTGGSVARAQRRSAINFTCSATRNIVSLLETQGLDSLVDAARQAGADPLGTKPLDWMVVWNSSDLHQAISDSFPLLWAFRPTLAVLEVPAGELDALQDKLSEAGYIRWKGDGRADGDALLREGSLILVPEESAV